MNINNYDAKMYKKWSMLCATHMLGYQTEIVHPYSLD